ncbi:MULTISPECIES: PAS domain-containing sensor histidine kinase [Silvimonas]|uniref:PAS domain-containing sensor histidine kinase n=1 Tax=Silvimonas TaxID=300264 RepID=UPI0024B3A920|nr:MULTISPECIES: ATP-binding protein [Silvimonas]MDR3425919.1 PAS domain S-box protein [Silvimonas sp.]
MSSPHRFARWLPLIPGLLAGVFTLAFAAWLLQSRDEATSQRSTLLEQDLLWQKQAIEQQITFDLQSLAGLAATLNITDLSEPIFQARVQSLIQSSPEIASFSVQNGHGLVLWHAATQNNWSVPYEGAGGWGEVSVSHGEPKVTYAIATPDRRRFIVAVFALDTLLQQQVPWWIAQRYQISLIDANGHPLAAKFQRQLDTTGISHTIQLTAPPLEMKLKGDLYAGSVSATGDILPALMLVLAIAMLASTAALNRMIKVRAQAEEQLKAEVAFRHAVDTSLVSGMIAFDRRGRIIYTNRAFGEMVGYSAEELRETRPPMPYWPPEEIERCQATYDAIVAGHVEPSGFMVRLMRRNGERFDVRIHASRLVDGDGHHIGWMGSLHDVTEIRREREALQASHERFVAVLNGLDASVAVTDAETGELLMSNLQFDRAFQLPDLRGRCCIVPLVVRRAEPPVDAEWYDTYRDHWYQVKSRQSTWVDGSAVWLEIATDITALKSASERERQQNEALQQTGRLISMGEMASSLAHELNQPLGAIASYVSGCRNLLSSTAPNLPQLGQALDKMGEQAKRAGHIIRGIREFVQRRAPRRQRCDINTLLETVLGLLGHEIVRRGVEISIAQNEGMPPIYADAVMLEQVLFNLIKNALEAMDATPRDRRTLAIGLSRDDEMLRVTIADRGVGIAPEQREQLFKPFFSTKDTGMGIGLNICRSIIEHHHGRMWVEENPGGGTRFIFTVPFPTTDEGLVEQDL